MRKTKEELVEQLKEYSRKIRDGEIERPKYKNPLESFRANPRSLKRGVNACCWLCMGSVPDWKTEVRKCSANNMTCAWYDYRLGSKEQPLKQENEDVEQPE